MLTAGLAGGFFASAAWRAWGPPAGLFFIPLWILNAIVGYYAVEARPFGLLLLAISLGIWSGTRLWIASTSEISNDNAHTALWITTILSPIVAAATIPIGIVAVIAIEISAASLLRRNVAELFARRWKFRTMLVLISVFTILLVFVPGILFKSTNYWTDEIMPFSVGSVGSLLGVMALQNGRWLANNSNEVKYAYALLMTMSVAGLFFKWNNFLGRVSAGLAIVFPVTMITASIFTSLLVPRYFLPMVPGLTLLAAGVASTRFSEFRSLLTGVSIIAISALVVTNIPYHSRVFTKQTEQQLMLLQGLEVSRINGAVTSAHLVLPLLYYVQQRLGFTPDLRDLKGPLKSSELPAATNELFWVFDRKNGNGKKWTEALPFVCRFALKSSDVYVVARDVVALPLSLGCDPIKAIDQ